MLLVRVGGCHTCVLLLIFFLCTQSPKLCILSYPFLSMESAFFVLSCCLVPCQPLSVWSCQHQKPMSRPKLLVCVCVCAEISDLHPSVDRNPP